MREKLMWWVGGVLAVAFLGACEVAGDADSLGTGASSTTPATFAGTWHNHSQFISSTTGDRLIDMEWLSVMNADGTGINLYGEYQSHSFYMPSSGAPAIITWRVRGRHLEVNSRSYVFVKVTGLLAMGLPCEAFPDYLKETDAQAKPAEPCRLLALDEDTQIPVGFNQGQGRLVMTRRDTLEGEAVAEIVATLPALCGGAAPCALRAYRFKVTSRRVKPFEGLKGPVPPPAHHGHAK